MSKCQSPTPTRGVFNAGYGANAWCPSCKQWRPAAQVRWGAEKRNARGEIVASYAPLPH